MEITRDTVIGEIVDNCPEAMPVFQEIGMHCLGCAMASGETVEQACAAHGVDPDEFLSMGRATPFAGTAVYGRCLKTVWKLYYELKGRKFSGLFWR